MESCWNSVAFLTCIGNNMQQLTYLLDKTLTVEDMCARVTAEPSYKDAADRLLIVFFPSCDRVEISDLLGRLRTQLLEVRQYAPHQG